MLMSGAVRRVHHLLIVDDEQAQARLFENLLTELGQPHQCHHAADGPQALDFLRRKGSNRKAPRPELIILDLKMPGMDGVAVLREIKRDPELRAIPVIMLSVSSAYEEFDRCYREYANACIRKPFDYESSVSLVRQIEQFWFHTAQLHA
jgi:two-component system, chemotaxis family, response regulator Rcp1